MSSHISQTSQPTNHIVSTSDVKKSSGYIHSPKTIMLIAIAGLILGKLTEPVCAGIITFTAICLLFKDHLINKTHQTFQKVISSPQLIQDKNQTLLTLNKIENASSTDTLSTEIGEWSPGIDISSEREDTPNLFEAKKTVYPLQNRDPQEMKVYTTLDSFRSLTIDKPLTIRFDNPLEDLESQGSPHQDVDLDLEYSLYHFLNGYSSERDCFPSDSRYDKTEMRTDIDYHGLTPCKDFTNVTGTGVAKSNNDTQLITRLSGPHTFFGNTWTTGEKRSLKEGSELYQTLARGFQEHGISLDVANRFTRLTSILFSSEVFSKVFSLIWINTPTHSPDEVACCETNKEANFSMQWVVKKSPFLFFMPASDDQIFLEIKSSSTSFLKIYGQDNLYEVSCEKTILIPKKSLQDMNHLEPDAPITKIEGLKMKENVSLKNLSSQGVLGFLNRFFR